MDGYGLSETDAEAESGKRWVPAARGWKGEVNLRSVLGSWFLPPPQSPALQERLVGGATHTHADEGRPCPPLQRCHSCFPTHCLSDCLHKINWHWQVETA